MSLAYIPDQRVEAAAAPLLTPHTLDAVPFWYVRSGLAAQALTQGL